MISDTWFSEPMASELTRLRIQARAKRRLTYDCLNAKVVGGQGKVTCAKKHTFPTIGSGLLTVLRGRSPQICQNCQDYDEEVTE